MTLSEQSETSTVKLPQPHEGMRGELRSEDDLLDLDEISVARRRVIAGVIRVLWQTALGATGTETGAALYQHMCSAKVGDLVVSTPAAFQESGQEPIKGFGVYLGQRMEWAHTDAEWDYLLANDDPDRERPKERAHYIQYGSAPEDVCRWIGCEVLAIPLTALVHRDANL